MTSGIANLANNCSEATYKRGWPLRSYHVLGNLRLESLRVAKMGDFYVLASGVDVDYQERRMKEGVDLFKKKKSRCPSVLSRWVAWAHTQRLHYAPLPEQEPAVVDWQTDRIWGFANLCG